MRPPGALRGISTNHALRLLVPFVALATLLSGCTTAPEQSDAADDTAVPMVPTPGLAPATPESDAGVGAPNATAAIAQPPQTRSQPAVAVATPPAANGTAQPNAPAPPVPAGNATADHTSPVRPGITPVETWPQEGSFVQYEVRRVGLARGAPVTTSSDITLTYQGGAWNGECVTDRSAAERIERLSRRGASMEVRATEAETFETLDIRPLVAIERGERARAVVLDGCDPRRVTVRMLDDGDAPRDVDERIDDARSSVAAARGGRGGQVDWDPDTGLVLSWSLPGRTRVVEGELVATDAPGVLAAPTPAPLAAQRDAGMAAPGAPAGEGAMPMDMDAMMRGDMDEMMRGGMHDAMHRGMNARR